MSNQNHIDLSIARLDASPFMGDYIYRADETGLDYVAHPSDLEDLGARLERGDHDAYSLWCAETVTPELTDLGGWCVGDLVEAGDNFEDYDTGEIIAVRRAFDGTENGADVQVAWVSGVKTWQRTEGLRNAGERPYTEEG